MPSSALSLKHKNLPQDQNVGGPGAEINLRDTIGYLGLMEQVVY